MWGRPLLAPYPNLPSCWRGHRWEQQAWPKGPRTPLVAAPGVGMSGEPAARLCYSRGARRAGKPQCLVACAAVPRSASSLKSAFQREYCKRSQTFTGVRTPTGEGCQKRGAQALPAHKRTSACSEDRKQAGAALGCFSLLPLGLQRPAGYGS